MSTNTQSGMSIIEIIIAVALFVIIAGSTTIAVLSSFSSTRLAKEELRATSIAEEGLEAVQAIRNEDWNNLAVGSYGLSNSGGSWVFSGASDIDTSGKYTRVITISSVERDVSDEVVSSGGTIDSQTFLISVVVSWNFTPTRNNSVEMSQYLTNWQLSTGTGSGGNGGITSCTDYCVSLTYNSGTCRQNTNQCSNNGETYEIGGDVYCPGGGGGSTCCCVP